MSAPGVEQLTERQKDCLRLVILHYDSKQIGRQLGITHHTVNKRVEQAMRLLEVGDRYRAARILAEYEHGADYERLVSEQVGLEASAQSAAKLQVSGASLRLEDEASGQAREPVDPAFAISAGLSSAETALEGRTRNKLAMADRLKLIALYGFGFLVAIAILASVADTVLRLLLRAAHGN